MKTTIKVNKLLKSEYQQLFKKVYGTTPSLEEITDTYMEKEITKLKKVLEEKQNE